MNAKTKAILIAGLVAFVAGGSGAAFLATRYSGAGAPASTRVKVLYTAGPVDAGTAASTAIAEGRIRTKAIAPADVPANAVRDATELSGRVAGANLAPEVVVTTDMFPAPQTRIGTVVIPPGKRALSLELQPVPGVSGFVGAGDLIDVYGVDKGDTPGVRLILQGVEVLNVNGAGLPAAQGQPGGPDLVYLLAVTPAEAERLIYMTEFEKLYFDLIPKGEQPVTTPGAGPSQVLQAL
jgi:Flp pilus assembly protein CpaB